MTTLDAAPAKPALINQPESASASGPLRRWVIISTVLSMALADGWMASFGRVDGTGAQGAWIWRTLVWGLVGGGTCVYFWAMLWPAKAVQGPTRTRVLKGFLVVAAPSVYWLSFPLYFISGRDCRDVLTGLTAAGLILGLGAWMMMRLIKAFEHSDQVETERLAREQLARTKGQESPGAATTAHPAEKKP